MANYTTGLMHAMNPRWSASRWVWRAWVETNPRRARWIWYIASRKILGTFALQFP